MTHDSRHELFLSISRLFARDAFLPRTQPFKEPRTHLDPTLTLPGRRHGRAGAVCAHAYLMLLLLTVSLSA